MPRVTYKHLVKEPSLCLAYLPVPFISDPSLGPIAVSLPVSKLVVVSPVDPSKADPNAYHPIANPGVKPPIADPPAANRDRDPPPASK